VGRKEGEQRGENTSPQKSEREERDWGGVEWEDVKGEGEGKRANRRVRGS